MTRIIIPETELERQIRMVRQRQVENMRRAAGDCITCGCDLATNIDQGILLCAHTHKEQYEAYKKSRQL